MILPETVSSTSAWSSPCLFPTKHWYIPLSECVRPLIVKLPLLKWYRSVSFTGLPLKYHLYCTTGNPKAMHGRTTDECETDVVSCGFVTHSGLAREIVINNYSSSNWAISCALIGRESPTMEVKWRWRNFFFSFSDAKKEVKTVNVLVKQTNKKQIDKHFPWFVFLWIIEMTSKCSKVKWNHRPQQHLPSIVMTVDFLFDAPESSLAVHMYSPASWGARLSITNLLTFPVVVPRVTCVPFFFNVILGTGLDKTLNKSLKWKKTATLEPKAWLRRSTFQKLNNMDYLIWTWIKYL